MGRYTKDRKAAVRRKKNTMRSQMIQSEGLAVHFERDLSMTDPYVATSIKESLKKGPR